MIVTLAAVSAVRSMRAVCFLRCVEKLVYRRRIQVAAPSTMSKAATASMPTIKA